MFKSYCDDDDYAECGRGKLSNQEGSYGNILDTYGRYEKCTKILAAKSEGTRLLVRRGRIFIIYVYFVLQYTNL
jgi:hypothetical protein